MTVDLSEIKFEGDECNFPDNPKPQAVNPDGHTSLFFTYSVLWKESQVKWASRWDYLLGMNDVQIHWFSIINSLIVVFFLSGMRQKNLYKQTFNLNPYFRNSDDDYGSNTSKRHRQVQY